MGRLAYGSFSKLVNSKEKTKKKCTLCKLQILHIATLVTYKRLLRSIIPIKKNEEQEHSMNLEFNCYPLNLNESLMLYQI